MYRSLIVTDVRLTRLKAHYSTVRFSRQSAQRPVAHKDGFWPEWVGNEEEAVEDVHPPHGHCYGMEWRDRKGREKRVAEKLEKGSERGERRTDQSSWGQSSPEGLSVYSMERGVRYPSLTDCYSCEAHSIM